MYRTFLQTVTTLAVNLLLLQRLSKPVYYSRIAVQVYIASVTCIQMRCDRKGILAQCEMLCTRPGNFVQQQSQHREIAQLYFGTKKLIKIK